MNTLILTNSQKIEAATRPYVGKTLTSQQVKAITQERFPEVNLSSIMASDFASPDCIYGDKLFTKTATSSYLVLPDKQIVRKTRNGRGARSVSMADALKAAKQLLNPKAPKQEEVRPTVAVAQVQPLPQSTPAQK